LRNFCERRCILILDNIHIMKYIDSLARQYSVCVSVSFILTLTVELFMNLIIYAVSRLFLGLVVKF